MDCNTLILFYLVILRIGNILNRTDLVKRYFVIIKFYSNILKLLLVYMININIVNNV